MTTTNYPALSGPIYPDTLDEQIRALESDDALRTFADARQRLSSDPYRPAVPLFAAAECDERPERAVLLAGAVAPVSTSTDPAARTTAFTGGIRSAMT